MSSSEAKEERRSRLVRYVTWLPEDLLEFNEALAAQRTLEAFYWDRILQPAQTKE